MTRYSSIVANEVRDNGLDGIFIEGAGVYDANISLFDNEAEGNHVFDCQDTGLRPALATRWGRTTLGSTTPAI